MIPGERQSGIAPWVVGGLGAIHVLAYVTLSLRGTLEPFRLFNLLLTVAIIGIGLYAIGRRVTGFFPVGVVLLLMAQVYFGSHAAADSLTSGAILLAGILVLYVGLKLDRHPGRARLLAFVAGYLVLFAIFILALPNAQPLFLLYVLGLAACARSRQMTAYFWAVVASFTFCQPYAWVSLICFCFLLAAVFGAEGRFRSWTTLAFLGGGLVVVLSLLFPIVAVMLGQDIHSLEVLLRDPRIRAALGLTLVSALVSTLFLAVTMTPLAYALARLRFPGRALLLSLVDMPIVIPQSAAGIALLCLLGRKQFVGGLLAERFGVFFDGTVLGICVAQAFVAMPFMAKSALTAFEGVDEELEAMAGVLGASPLSAFLRVALPLAAPGVVLGAVLAFARAAGEFGALVFLAPTPETAPVAVFNRFNSAGMAEAAPLVSLLLLLSLGTFFLLQLSTRLLPSARRTHHKRMERK